MKIIASGDWHIRSTTPTNRVDDYTLAQKIKVMNLLATAGSESLPILQPGDFFDTPRINFVLLSEMIQLFDQYRAKIYAVFGQHDLRYHTSHNDTPLALLNKIQRVILLGKQKYILGGQTKGNPGMIDVYGASWGDEIPVPHPSHNYKVLVLHKMIIGDKKLWDQQEGHVWAREFLGKYPDYNLIISGDNHQTFTVKSNNRILINCGSLMRMTIDQKDHKPCFYIVDTVANTLEEHLLPFEPFDKVMNVEKVEKEKKRTTDLDAFVSGLKGMQSDLGMDFAHSIQTAVEKNKVDKRVHQVILDCMKEKE